MHGYLCCARQVGLWTMQRCAVPHAPHHPAHRSALKTKDGSLSVTATVAGLQKQVGNGGCAAPATPAAAAASRH